MATFANRLKALREASGMSQQELADRLGVNKQTISGYERGVRRPAGETALDVYETLADIFHVDLMYLLGHHDQVERLTGTPDDPDDAIVNVMLTLEEVGIVKALRQTTPAKREAVKVMLDVGAGAAEAKSEPPAKRSLADPGFGVLFDVGAGKRYVEMKDMSTGQVLRVPVEVKTYRKKTKKIPANQLTFFDPSGEEESGEENK